ncbi:MAG: GNAT family N-acetyltransferase [Spirochaetaceae bacterium]|nr:GNAT family N-acetyltransferase [Spirochaetaceae bacterium]
MPILIRPAVYSDIPYLYEICLKTGDSGKDASALFNDPCLLGQYYAAPYLFYDPSLCFIAENDLTPEGYIIATADTEAFNTWMEKEWLPPLRRRYPQPYPQERLKSPEEAHSISRIHSSHLPVADPWQAAYPAHLHIDLLPSLQGKGSGRALMETLFKKLEEIHCPGIQLGVSGTNIGAIGFYKKLGFSILEEKTWGLQMGKAI